MAVSAMGTQNLQGSRSVNVWCEASPKKHKTQPPNTPVRMGLIRHMHIRAAPRVSVFNFFPVPAAALRPLLPPEQGSKRLEPGARPRMPAS